MSKAEPVDEPAAEAKRLLAAVHCLFVQLKRRFAGRSVLVVFLFFVFVLPVGFKRKSLKIPRDHRWLGLFFL